MNDSWRRDGHGFRNGGPALGAAGRASLLVALLAGAGCGGGAGAKAGTDAAAGDAPVSDIGGAGGDPAVFAEKYCALFAPCCAELGLPPPGAACRALWENTAGAVGRTAQYGDQCLAELQGALTKKGYCDPSVAVPACQVVLGAADPNPAHGSVAFGAACQLDSDCVASSRGQSVCTIDLTSANLTRKCQEQIVGAKGDNPCIGTIPAGGGLNTAPVFLASGVTCDVADGIYCDTVAGACAALRQPGQPCSATDFFACVTNYCVDGICTARTPIGVACDVALMACVDGAFCDGTTSTCVRAKPIGAACTTFDECVTSTCDNGTCRPVTTSLGAMCGAAS